MCESTSLEYKKKTNILLKKEYFLDVLDREPFELQQRKEHFNELGIGLCAQSPFLLLLGRIENSSDRIPAFERNKLLYSVKLIGDKCFSPTFSLEQIEIEKYSLLWIIQPNALDQIPENKPDNAYWNRMTIIEKGMAETFQSTCRESLGISLSIIYDSEPVTWETLSDKYRSIKEMLKYLNKTWFEMLIERKAVESWFFGLGDEDAYKEDNREEDKAPKSRAYHIIDCIKRHIHENIGGDLSITTLSDIVYMNPQYLCRLFKRIENTTILAYINEVKLRKAKELLRDSNKKVQEIADALGFLSASYFSQYYKKYTNMSPTEYRTSIIRCETSHKI